jgi:hypothetical protein
MQDSDDIIEDAGALRRMNVLYLVNELEAAVHRGGISWCAEDAERVPERLVGVSSAVRRQAGN